MDTAIGDDGQPKGGLGILANQPGVDRPSFVLLRVENNGTESIGEADYTNPDKNHGLRVVFTDRVIRGVDVIADPKATHLLSHFTPTEGKGGMQHDGNTVHLPRVPLNTDHYFKLLVLLSGGSVGRKVEVSGGIRDGRVEPTRSITIDDKPPLFSKLALGSTVVLAVCLFLLAGIVIFRHSPPMGCVRGRLRIVGSTAFAPTASAAAHRYTAQCPGTGITVDARGSNEGVQQLAESRSPGLLAMSDGPKPASFTRLRGSQVAVLAFALVVGDDVTVRNLTVDQIRRIYRAEVVNWKQLGGPDLPIRLISRDAASGTREQLRRHLLKGAPEPPFTSRDCVNKNSPQDKIVRCELGSTDEVLAAVAHVPGAIGYAELQAAVSTRRLHTLTIDGRSPSIAAIGDSSYRFTEIEYAYTAGTPAPGSLLSSFLNYLVRGGGQDALRSSGQLPCYSPDGLERCRSGSG